MGSSRLNFDELSQAMDVALDKRPASLVVLNGQIVNVCTGEIYAGGVAVAGNRIAKMGDVKHCVGDRTVVVDAEGAYLVPGLIDTHIHIESTMLSMTRFAEAVLPRGTTSVMCDLHEVGLVAGLRGIREIVEEARRLPFKEWLSVCFEIPMTPSKVETVGGHFSKEALKKMLTWPEAVGWDELSVPMLLSKNADVVDKIARARELGKVTDGPCGIVEDPQRVISACVCAGVDYSHEGEWTTKGELEMLRDGMRVNFIEGGNVWMQNLKNQAKVITEHHVQSRHISFATDDLSAEDIAERGHIDHDVRRTIEEGVDPVTAIQIGTLNAAELFRIDYAIGSITPSRYADILLVRRLEEFKVDTTISMGKVVAKNGTMVMHLPKTRYTPTLTQTVRLKRKLRAADFLIRTKKNVKKVRVHTLVSNEELRGFRNGEAVLDVENGVVLPSIQQDVILIAVAERHRASGRVSAGFAFGLGLKMGAIGTTVAHDHHNIVLIGTTPDDMAFAGNEIARMHGGQVAVSEGKVLNSLPLPIVGLMADIDVQTMAEKIKSMKETLRGMGCKLTHPFMHLGFFTGALTGWGWETGRYNITDKGWVDLERQKILSPIISADDVTSARKS
ncbi:MAG: adenine deaminase C-terminal domain-containing protein [Candidatus Bathyarchaeia archaeon]|jgi:adenine deaminase